MVTRNLMGNARVMKPYWRFENQYDRIGADPLTLSGEIPIPIMPVGPTIPAIAGVDNFAWDNAVRENRANYSPRLASMLPMSQVGSDVCVWIPSIPSILGNNVCYVYVPIWRMRTPVDQREYSIQSHMPKEGFGSPDTRPVIGGDRYIIPASCGNVILSKQEFISGVTAFPPSNLQVSSMLREGIAIPATPDSTVRSPIGPDGNDLEYQQGVLDPVALPYFNHGSMYRQYWLKVAGDELGFLVFKILYPLDTTGTITYVDWDFDYDPVTGLCSAAAEDIYFSCVYGVGSGVDGTMGMLPNTGLYAMTGLAG